MPDGFTLNRKLNPLPPDHFASRAALPGIFNF
jgi:hypothetical protein